MQAPRSIWQALNSRSPSPVITYINVPLAERVELSGPSLTNVAAKIANALVMEFDLEPGDTVHLSLPWHWQRAAWQAGCYTAGITPQFTEPTDLSGSVRLGDEQFAVSMHPFGLPLPGVANDITPLIQAQPDALLIAPDSSTALLEEAAAYARDHGVQMHDRIIVRADDSRDDRLLPLAVPLAMQGSLIMLCGSAADTAIEEGATREWSRPGHPRVTEQ